VEIVSTRTFISQCITVQPEEEQSNTLLLWDYGYETTMPYRSDKINHARRQQMWLCFNPITLLTLTPVVGLEQSVKEKCVRGMSWGSSAQLTSMEWCRITGKRRKGL